MKRWLVYTPAFGVLVPVTYDGQGPFESEADVVEVEAVSKRDAVRLGVAEMLRRGMRYCHDQRSDGCCPYTGVKAIAYE